ncbi:hypothetical protein CONCODRAFT_19596 [Conidiobolus coronatus NRRL 28638]|uniref:Yeast cell wall synthesis Kre9/Knh1-like N-terminal domain-containing protein n=1 Tax=Conidiobolus coronatus (strain ATCC 28846 / CBS 209.66 / NRRL 28638) TaxID=796925 RepID=A0A137NXG5_CONC2|nr:hypothetical protein CONCODRAFT_19596 [Conidiobolus coronatus NRRL 28638]|eukprot:KXN67466.1 hypothetical protein CONCODRAFT_19596 [Conidiobolus coronatus NRRL 28638]
MKAFIYSSFIASLLAGFSPGAPYSGSTWPVGTEQKITYKWVDQSDDTTSFNKVAKVNIDFMTGPDENAEYISDIAHGLDPKTTEISWKIPDVPKDGKIYFIRINSLDKDNKVLQNNWSTRFTINGSTGKGDSDPTTIPPKDKPTSTSTKDDDKDEKTTSDKKDKATKTTSGKDKPTSTTESETTTTTEATTTTTTKAKTTTTSKVIPTDPPSSAKSAFAVSGLSLLSAAIYALL